MFEKPRPLSPPKCGEHVYFFFNGSLSLNVLIPLSLQPDI